MGLAIKLAELVVDVGVAYSSDMHKVHDLIIEVALESDFCLKDPQTRCCMVEFSNSSVNFILYFGCLMWQLEWLFAKSEIMFKIWDKFKEHNIEIPFPQRDVNFRNPLKLI